MGELPAKAEGPSPDHDNDQERGRDACDRDGGCEADGGVRQPVVVDLPMPPSVNEIWKAGRGGQLYRSPKYSAWLKEAGWEIKRQRPGKVEGPYTADIILRPKTNRRRDAHNFPKGILDLLKDHAVTDDDSLIPYPCPRWWTAEDEHIEPGWCRVIVRAAA